MRSKRYQKIKLNIDKKKDYSLEEAIKIIKENASAKFDETIELHIQLGINPRKTEQQVRGVVTLPHGIVKKRKIIAFVKEGKEKDAEKAGADLVGGRKLIQKIQEEGSCNFDIVVAHSDLMVDLAKIAKILGPKGLMPSPKAGTIGLDVPGIIKELRRGKITFKNDAGANLHQAVAKISWDLGKIKENIKEYLNIVKKAKPAGAKGVFIKKVFLCSTMGPALKITI
ncbi:50S ribosomal protein L1 [Candidatus Parcubacteria bacterium 4484_255]|nr:MAG: 50S ribosomal protein L1 [Candidatus Parcubacteria bacterium 4484_255]